MEQNQTEQKPPRILFSPSKLDPSIDLYPILKDGANINIIGEHIPGNLYAKDHSGKRKPTALYHRLYRHLKALEKKGILVKEKGTQDLGLGDRPSVWWRPSTQFVTGYLKPLNLISRAQNSNSMQMTPLDPEEKPNYNGPKWAQIPKRTNPKRVGAALRLMRIKTKEEHWLFVRQHTGKYDKYGHEIKILQPILVKMLKEPDTLYKKYLDEIDDKKIMLVPRGQKKRPDPEKIKFIPYRTRFNDPGRRRRNLDRYDFAWEIAEEDYSTGIYITLTTDPAMHENLWTANRHAGPAWNRYMSKIQKKYKIRPKFIKVVEFQENGLIHLHCVFFGLSRITNISTEWENTGQGRITKAIPIKLDENHLWQWAGKRPDDAREGESVSDYLKVYLKKSVFNPQDLFLYWTCNTKFFTCSRSFTKPTEQKPQGPPQWDYLGVTPGYDLPQWVTYISECPTPPPIPLEQIPQTWAKDNPYKKKPLFTTANKLINKPRPTGGDPAEGLNLADFM